MFRNMFSFASVQTRVSGWRWSIMRLAGLALLATILLVGSPTPRAEAATTFISVGDFWFCNSSFAFGGVCPTTVAVGDTVEWDFTSSIFAHTSTDCGPNCSTGPFGGVWDSGTIFGGGSPFQHTFTEPGTFLYYCTLHPTTMRGEITVTTAVGGVAELPDAVGSPQQAPASQGGGTDFAVVSAAAGVAAAAMVVVGVFARRRWSR